MLLMYLAGIIIGLPFVFLGKFALVLPTLMSIAAVAYIVLAKWEVRRHVWFWPLIVVVAVLHVLAIIFVPWTTTSLPSIVALPFVVADVALVLGIITFLERHFDSPKSRQASP
jgi:hypothetical protein